MNTESPLLQILLTKFEAKRSLDALPSGDQVRKLRNKIVACDLAINFLKANSESGRQFLACNPNMAAPAPRWEKHPL